jgi:hypothetical protein
MEDSASEVPAQSAESDASAMAPDEELASAVPEANPGAAMLDEEPSDETPQDVGPRVDQPAPAVPDDHPSSVRSRDDG